MSFSPEPGYSPPRPGTLGGAKPPPPRRRRWRRLFLAAVLLTFAVVLAVASWSQYSPVRTLGQHAEPVRAVGFAPDGATLYSGCWGARNPFASGKAWDVGTGREQHTLPRGLAVTLSPDCRLVATLDPDSPTIDVWETATGAKRATLREAPLYQLYRMAFSPDGKVLATAGCFRAPGVGSGDEGDPVEVGLWDLAGGKKARWFAIGTERVTDVAFAPDGKALASAGWGKGLELWDVERGTKLETPAAEGGERPHPVSRVAYSPDGRYLAALARPKVLVWELPARKLVASLRWDGYGPPACVAFSPDSRLLAAGGDYDFLQYFIRGCQVTVWETGTWRQRPPVKGRINGDTVYCLAFSPDGSRLALGTFRGYVGLLATGR